LIVSALVPYKRIDLAIEAFNRIDERLVIIGTGPEEAKLRRLARRNIEFVGWQPDERLREYYAGCKAVIFPGEEDFGIVPVEAMAAGKPVIAYGRGGALETVRDTPARRTGILFHEQSVASLLDALRRFGEIEFSPQDIRRHALQFDRSVYKERMMDYVLSRWRMFNGAVV
jgi:glycosyltransferase involved in cell wall biosynthesis